jgi:NAD(P)-dependent dehydrogenase (short-subunit alcohol dehydrogenase family)
MTSTVLTTGAGSGFGLHAAKTLAKFGHIVYGRLHFVHGSTDPNKDDANSIRDVILDITDKNSIDAAIKRILSETGKIDSVVHSADHMGMGPAESFSADQFHQYYDINAIRAHRLNQAVLPLMRKAERGHIVWVSSSSSLGGSGPLLAPYLRPGQLYTHSQLHSLQKSLAGVLKQP